jgi:hypothetical protein
MNLHNGVFLILLLGAGTAAAESAWIRAMTNPEGVLVLVDGAVAGTTPVTIETTAGPHDVWFRSLPPSEFEPQPVPVRSVEVVSGDTLLVVENVGFISTITSKPPGAAIELGGKILGVTPTQVRWGRDASLEFHVVAPRHERAIVRFADLVPGGSVHIDLVVERDEPSVPGERPRSTPRWLPWGVLAASGASAALAVYLKEEADEEFERYEESALPAEMTRRIDRADRLDRLSATAWIAAEVGVVVSFWLFRSEILEDRGDPVHLSVAPDRVGVVVPW